MNGAKKYSKVITSPIFVFDALGNPVPGVLIHFEFPPNHVGELRLSQRDFDDDKGKAEIEAYITRVYELSGDSF
jgi:hypothetical protein